jgi:hypothetical protein
VQTQQQAASLAAPSATSPTLPPYRQYAFHVQHHQHHHLPASDRVLANDHADHSRPRRDGVPSQIHRQPHLNTLPIAQAGRRNQAHGSALTGNDRRNRSLPAGGDEKRIKPLEKKEEMVDLLQKRSPTFWWHSPKSILPRHPGHCFDDTHSHDLERVGDHCENLWQLGLRKRAKGCILRNRVVEIKGAENPRVPGPSFPPWAA